MKVDLIKYLNLLDTVLSFTAGTKGSSYFVVTSGCPADHVSGFKNGGLKKMLSDCQTW